MKKNRMSKIGIALKDTFYEDVKNMNSNQKIAYINRMATESENKRFNAQIKFKDSLFNMIKQLYDGIIVDVIGEGEIKRYLDNYIEGMPLCCVSKEEKRVSSAAISKDITCYLQEKIKCRINEAAINLSKSKEMENDSIKLNKTAIELKKQIKELQKKQQFYKRNLENINKEIKQMEIEVELVVGKSASKRNQASKFNSEYGKLKSILKKINIEELQINNIQQ